MAGGVSLRYVTAAVSLKKTDPLLFTKVKEGKIPLLNALPPSQVRKTRPKIGLPRESVSRQLCRRKKKRLFTLSKQTPQ
jgi:hypothetical protein